MLIILKYVLKRVHINYCLNIEHIREKTYEDQFMDLVRTIDFSNKSKKKKEKEENKNKNQNEWVWSKVNDSIT